MTEPHPHAHAVFQERVRFRVLSKGSGPALVFLHGPWGLTWDPFLDHLARTFTVHAPEHPGTTPGRPDDASQLDGLWDLVLCYDELLDALGLETAIVVGHSFGGMVACELAAHAPRRVRGLGLIAPIGLWRDDAPVVNWMMLNPGQLPGRIFADPGGTVAQQLFAPGGDAEAAAMAQVRLVWAMGTTGKFIWPLPDKGLRKRLHRVTARTLVVWGRQDALVPPVYGEEFVRRIPGARLETVEGAGHMPHLEQPDTVVGLLRDVLK